MNKMTRAGRLAPLLLAVVIGGCSEAMDPNLPVRLGLFKGVDGVTYSADGSGFGLYEKYANRETVVRVSQSELADVAQRLMEAGLADEQTRVPQWTTVPPQSYDVIIVWKDRKAGCRWWHQPGYQIPEKYLDALEAMPPAWKRPLLTEILRAHWRLHAKEAGAGR